MDYKIFVVYIIAFDISLDTEKHLLKKTRIAHLKVDKTFIKIFSKYADFVDVFLQKLAVKLPKYMGINNHAIEWIDNWQFLYNFICNLGPIKLKILKAYIKNNLANSFIRSSKFSAGAPIFFN